MMSKLTKMVDGKIIPLTQEETDATLAEWEEGDKNIQRNVKRELIEEKIRYLQNTDWYVLRNVEKEGLMPEDISNKRELYRTEISQLREELNNI